MGPIMSPEMSDKMPLFQVQKAWQIATYDPTSPRALGSPAFDVEDEGTFPPANSPGLLQDKGERHSFSHYLPEKEVQSCLST